MASRGTTAQRRLSGNKTAAASFSPGASQPSPSSAASISPPVAKTSFAKPAFPPKSPAQKPTSFAKPSPPKPTPAPAPAPVPVPVPAPAPARAPAPTPMTQAEVSATKRKSAGGTMSFGERLRLVCAPSTTLNPSPSILLRPRVPAGPLSLVTSLVHVLPSLFSLCDISSPLRFSLSLLTHSFTHSLTLMLYCA